MSALLKYPQYPLSQSTSIAGYSAQLYELFQQILQHQWLNAMHFPWSCKRESKSGTQVLVVQYVQKVLHLPQSLFLCR